MKKKTSSMFMLLAVIIVLISNMYFEMQYDINLMEYFNKSSELTNHEIKWLKSHGKIIYGSDSSSPPLRYIDERSGQYRGIIVDYIMALSIDLQHEISFEPLSEWNDAIDSLEGDEKDFFDMIASVKRSEKFAFSDPIYTLRGVILTAKEDKTIKGYMDLVGKKVAIPKGDYAIEFLDSRVNAITYILTTDMESAVNLMNTGEVDAVIGDEPVITYLIDKQGVKDEYKISSAIYERDSVLAVKKSEDILLSILNKGIYNLKKKNVMSDIQKKWFGISNEFSKDNTSEQIIFLVTTFICVVMLIIYLSYSWNSSLKREVKKQTEELYRSRRNLRITFDGLTHLMLVIDEDYKIVNANKAFCRFVKSEQKDIIGRNCNDFKEILYGHDVESIVDDTFKTGKQNRSEFKYKNKVFETSSFSLNDEKFSEQNVLIMVKDITSIRINDQRLLQDSKMLAMGVLATGVAHEIRNPLGLIENYTYILRTNKNNDPVRTEKALTVIENSVERASKIIDNLLNFSRISSNECVPTKMKDFINAILELEHKSLTKRNIEYNVKCDDDLVCCTKHESLKHIFVNLISNAADAMKDGGVIDIYCYSENNTLNILFRDNGVGIDKDDLENIFTPFFTTKEPGKGTGLGLYIVYNEVLKSGGEINVNSKKSKGTTFDILIPLGKGANDEYKTQII